MTRIAYLMLAHEPADHLIARLDLLLEADPTGIVVLHYDARSPDAEFDRLAAFAGTFDRVFVVAPRLQSDWGRYSLVEATLRGIDCIAEKAATPVDRVLLLSGTCLPTRPLSEFKAFLAEYQDRQFIECRDGDWMKGGLRNERWQYRFPFSFKRSRRLFEFTYKYQRKLVRKRRLPKGLIVKFGSQWWCLTWDLALRIRNYLKTNSHVEQFFRTVWIPDEMVFQTLAYSLSDPTTIADHSLTYHRFSRQGKPQIFRPDNAELAFAQPFYFARKCSSELIEHAKESVNGKSPALTANEIGKPISVDTLILSERRLRSKPGQIFRKDQLRTGPPGAVIGLSEMPSIVVFGPRVLTEPLASVFKTGGDYEVFGNLFKRDAIDFGSNRTDFGGLESGHSAWRDYHPELFVARLFERCAKTPVLQISSLDAPGGFGAVAVDRNSIVVDIRPLDNGNRTATGLELLLSLLSADCELEPEIAAMVDQIDASLDIYRSLPKALPGPSGGAVAIERLRELLGPAPVTKEPPTLKDIPPSRIYRFDLDIAKRTPIARPNWNAFRAWLTGLGFPAIGEGSPKFPTRRKLLAHLPKDWLDGNP